MRDGPRESRCRRHAITRWNDTPRNAQKPHEKSEDFPNVKFTCVGLWKVEWLRNPPANFTDGIKLVTIGMQSRLCTRVYSKVLPMRRKIQNFPYQSSSSRTGSRSRAMMHFLLKEARLRRLASNNFCANPNNRLPRKQREET
jgi:hypothetical protein